MTARVQRGLLRLVVLHRPSETSHSGAELQAQIMRSSEGYFRSAYMPHPSLSGMMTPEGLFSLGLLRLAGMVAIASYLVELRGPAVLLFAGLGVLFLTLYAGGPCP